MFTFRRTVSTESCCLQDRCSVEKKKELCPVCKQESDAVSTKTLESLLIDQTKSVVKHLDGFFFCHHPSCATVYFKKDIILEQKELTISVGLKEDAPLDTICYCFKWTQKDIDNELIRIGRSSVLDDIKQKMHSLGCSCETLNPSGKCCLAGIKKFIKERMSVLKS